MLFLIVYALRLNSAYFRQFLCFLSSIQPVAPSVPAIHHGTYCDDFITMSLLPIVPGPLDPLRDLMNIWGDANDALIAGGCPEAQLLRITEYTL